MARKALIVWGGWDGHEPKQCMEIFAPILEAEGFDVTVSNSMDSYTDSEFMKALSLIVPIWTMGTIEGEQEKANDLLGGHPVDPLPLERDRAALRLAVEHTHDGTE